MPKTNSVLEALKKREKAATAAPTITVLDGFGFGSGTIESLRRAFDVHEAA